MAHAWKACWVQALGGSNPPSSATNPGPSGSGFFYALFTSTFPTLLFLDDAAPRTACRCLSRSALRRRKQKIPPRIAWRELVAVAPGFEPGVACTTQHFECCTFGRSDTLPRLLNLPEITANTQTLLTRPQSHRNYTPQTRQAVTEARATSDPEATHTR